jgi:mannose-6-phosphate isomerase-like protein (cupin superfamily)
MTDDALITADTLEFWTRERCFISELVNDACIPEFSLARTRVEPGVRTELHTLTVNEWYVIESGSGSIEVGLAAPRAVSAGDVVRIPAGVAQRITNTGETDLTFQCVCLPRFTPDAYQSLENT